MTEQHPDHVGPSSTVTPEQDEPQPVVEPVETVEDDDEDQDDDRPQR